MQWQDDALVDLKESDLSLREIGLKYGRSPDTIRDLRDKFSIVRPRSGRIGTKKTIDIPYLSAQHRTLGLKMTIFRGLNSYTQMAELYGVSRYVVRMMEIGAHDFTLNQLLTISNIMGQPLETLIKPQ